MRSPAKLLKPVGEVSGVHKAQLLRYMKLSGIGTGLLLNSNVQPLMESIERFTLCVLGGPAVAQGRTTLVH